MSPELVDLSRFFFGKGWANAADEKSVAPVYPLQSFLFLKISRNDNLNWNIQSKRCGACDSDPACPDFCRGGISESRFFWLLFF